MKMVHKETHFGIGRTLYIINQCYPELGATHKEVGKIIDSCFQCKSIDPAPVRWEKGELSVKDNWSRLACDITHFCEEAFISLINCGPSRFVIWRPIANKTIQAVSSTIVGIFREWGPPEQLLVDNATTFKSQRYVSVCENWNVSVIYRAAHRPSATEW